MKQRSETNVWDVENQGVGASMAPIDEGRASVSSEESEAAIDDRGTDQAQAAQILLAIRDAAFDSSDEKLALALGRSSDEIAEWLDGKGNIDSDGLIKAGRLPRRVVSRPNRPGIRNSTILPWKTLSMNPGKIQSRVRNYRFDHQLEMKRVRAKDYTCLKESLGSRLCFH